MKRALPKGLQLFPDVISEAEELSLLGLVDQRMRRKIYEKVHWDGVIFSYRESEVPLAELGDALKRIVAAHLPSVALLPLAHVLDIAEGGRIDHHIDSIKFMGGLVAPLSLGGGAVLQLKRGEDVVHVDVPRRSLYVMEGESRYEWSHAVLPLEQRRVSIIMRDFKNDPDDPMARLMNEIHKKTLI